MDESLKNKRVLVVGMARSGLAAAKLLCQLGATAVLSDNKTEIDGIDELVKLGCEARPGEPAESLVEGCDAVVVSPAVWYNAPVILKAQELGVPVMSELDFAFRHCPGNKFAISGTNGKTTTVTLVAEMLRNAGRNAFTAGNIGIPLSHVALEARPGDDIVIEVSSFQMEMTSEFHPHGAILTNLTPDHLNRHGTMEVYGALKARMVAKMDANDFFVYNADDAFCVRTAEACKARKVPFSRTQKLKNGAYVQDGQVIVGGRALCAAEEIRIPGPHNLENALAASALAAEAGVPLAVIRHTLRTFAGVEHRMEFTRELDGVRWINDSKGTNPEATMRGVEGMAAPTVLILGGSEKGTPFDALAQVIVANPNIRKIVTIGATAEKIETALRAAGFTDITPCGSDFNLAIETCRKLAQPGWTVLFSPACASFDMFSDYEARGRIFKELVNKLN